jgi:hypothetical protein
MRCLAAWSLLVALGCPSPALAEETPPATLWTFEQTVDACSLAQAVDVQKELKLSAKQATRLKQLADTWRKRNHDFRKANRRPAAADVLKEHRDLLADATAIVSPEQLQRLRQIHFQCEGVAAVLPNHEQAAALFNLSREQLPKLIEIQIASDKQRADAFKKGMEASKNPLDLFKGGSEEETKRLQEKNKQALALLTPAQQQAWEKLIGKPFQGRLVDAKGKKVHPRLESL